MYYLKYMALGKSSSETAIELFISLGTVDTHRKNIRKKLETKSYFELSQYARSFDLIWEQLHIISKIWDLALQEFYSYYLKPKSSFARK